MSRKYEKLKTLLKEQLCRATSCRSGAVTHEEIVDIEDEIERKRDELIAALERRLNQRSHSVRLFRIRWNLT